MVSSWLAGRLGFARGRRLVAGLVVSVLAASAVALAGQPDEPIKGEAALRHAAVQLAVKSAELIKAGKFDEAYALRTKEQQAEWKTMSAVEKREWAEATTKVTPDPRAFADAVRKTGELSIMGNSGVLGVTMPNARGMAYFALEGGIWRISNGPLAFANQP